MGKTRAAMQIYLPIAEVSVNALTLIGLGGIVGLMSGLFGVGGGFLITPLLFFIGIPPAIAVATGANQVVASSVTGVLAHLRRKSVDIRMGVVLLIGGIVGSTLGVGVFTLLQRVGQVDLVVQLSYVVFLGFIGLTMLRESLSAMIAARSSTVPPACISAGCRRCWSASRGGCWQRFWGSAAASSWCRR